MLINFDEFDKHGGRAIIQVHRKFAQSFKVRDGSNQKFDVFANYKESFHLEINLLAQNYSNYYAEFSIQSPLIFDPGDN